MKSRLLSQDVKLNIKPLMRKPSNDSVADMSVDSKPESMLILDKEDIEKAGAAFVKYKLSLISNAMLALIGFACGAM
jgi:hypothetical protein